MTLAVERFLVGDKKHLAGQVGDQLVLEEAEDLLSVVSVQVGVYFIEYHDVVALGERYGDQEGQLADGLLAARELADVEDEAFVGRSRLVDHPL